MYTGRAGSQCSWQAPVKVDRKAASLMLARLMTFQGRAGLLRLLLAMATNAVCEVLSILAVYPYVALASDPGLLQRSGALQSLHTMLGEPPLQTFVTQLAGLFLLTFLVTMASHAFSLALQQSYVVGLRQALSNHLLARYLHKEHGWLLQHHTVDMSKHVLADVDRLVQEVVFKSLTVLGRGFAALLIGLTLLLIHPGVALSVSFTLLLCYRHIYGFFRSRVDALGRQRLEANGLRHQLAQESLSALKEARLTHRRELLSRAFEKENQAYTEVDRRVRWLAEMPRYLTETLAIVALVGVFCFLVWQGQDPRLAFPWVGLYILALWRQVPNLQEIYCGLVDVRLNWPLLEKLDPEWERLAPAGPRPSLEFSQQIRLRQVTFSYPGASRPALQEVDLEIVRGSMVGLVGKTGSGKTTCADLIAGHLQPDPQGGCVEVDGLPLGQEGWGAQLGYVPQTIFLSSDSLAANIALGIPAAQVRPEALQRALQMAQLQAVLERLPQGLDTPLGERGLQLSGGERQRIGIARALYEQPQVLVFDEATSALDSHTEAEIMQTLEPLRGSHTLILVAHRLDSLRLCDRLFLFEEGRLQAQGSWEELQSHPLFQALQVSGGEQKPPP